MPRSNGRGGRNNNPSGRNQYSDWGVMDMVRERPVAAAAAAAGAAAAGLFLWSKRTQITNQLSSLSDQIGEWKANMGSGDDAGETTTAQSGLRGSTSSRREMSETGSDDGLGRSSGATGSGGTPSGRGRNRSTAAPER